MIFDLVSVVAFIHFMWKVYKHTWQYFSEDLVHSEISLPENAPKEFADRATLWNSIELAEKGQKAQLARMLKASLPNDWSYEVAEEVVRDYVQRNL